MYQQLCELVKFHHLFLGVGINKFQADDGEYAWVRRHTWQSWRERYKKNSDRLDNIIAGIVAETKPVVGEKGQYGYVREKTPRKRRSTKVKDEKDDEALRAEMAQLQTQRPLSHLPPLPVDGPSSLAGPSGPPRLVDGQAAHEEEMEDGDEEWPIRVGVLPAPTWAKRPASSTSPEGSPHKRPRTK